MYPNNWNDMTMQEREQVMLSYLKTGETVLVFINDYNGCKFFPRLAHEAKLYEDRVITYNEGLELLERVDDIHKEKSIYWLNGIKPLLEV